MKKYLKNISENEAAEMTIEQYLFSLTGKRTSGKNKEVEPEDIKTNASKEELEEEYEHYYGD
jgi:hypothetical protein